MFSWDSASIVRAHEVAGKLETAEAIQFVTAGYHDIPGWLAVLLLVGLLFFLGALVGRTNDKPQEITKRWW